MGFSRQEWLSGLPLPSSVDQVLLEFSTMTSVLGGLHGMTHSFIKLHKSVIHVIILASFL